MSRKPPEAETPTTTDLIPGRRRDVRQRARPLTEPKLLRALWENVDPEEFRQALLGSRDKRFQQLMDQIWDPRNGRCSIGVHWTFQHACKQCGLTLDDLLAFWRKHQLAVAEIRMLSQLPEVAERNAEEAVPHWEPCMDCDGSGRVPCTAPKAAPGSTVFCKRCKGKGRIWVDTNMEARKLVFAHAGIGGGGDRSVNVNVNTVGASMVAVESILDRASRALSPPSAEDVKLIEAAPASEEEQ